MVYPVIVCLGVFVPDEVDVQAVAALDTAEDDVADFDLVVVFDRVDVTYVVAVHQGGQGRPAAPVLDGNAFGQDLPNQVEPLGVPEDPLAVLVCTFRDPIVIFFVTRRILCMHKEVLGITVETALSAIAWG